MNFVYMIYLMKLFKPAASLMPLKKLLNGDLWNKWIPSLCVWVWD